MADIEANSNCSNGYGTLYDLLIPDHGKGLYVTPDSVQEWAPGGSVYPFSESNCSSQNNGVYYSPLDSKGRATEIRACLSGGNYGHVTGSGKDRGNADSMIQGSPVPWRLKPYSDPENPPGLHGGLDRGHLLANRLGGTGLDRRNLTPPGQR